MKKNYVAERNNSYAGVLMHGADALRRMGFSIVEGLCRDSQYDAIDYYIDGVVTRKQTREGFIIQKLVHLEEIIKCKEFAKPGKFDNGLTQADADYIFSTLIAEDKWINHNSQLFGYKKDKSGVYLPTGSNAELDPNLFDALKEIYKTTNNLKTHKDEPGAKLLSKRK